MDKQQFKDEEFIQIVTLCAEQNGCKISFINFDTHTIEIDAPDTDTEIKCAIAIEDVLGKYLMQEDTNES
jgi:hypothetical protein